MPERHAGSDSGSSSSSSSGGSSWSSSSSSSSGSSWSSRRYGSDGPRSPEEQAFGWAVLVIMLIVVAVFWIGNQVQKSNKQRDNVNATATTKAITEKDLAEMHAALDGRIADWKQVTDRTIHHVSASDAGLNDGNTKEVAFGYCASNTFYVYVLELSHPDGWLADTEGYAYTPDSYPQSCAPEGWQIKSDDNVGNFWHFVTINTSSATATARPTNTAAALSNATATVPLPTHTKTE